MEELSEGAGIGLAAVMKTALDAVIVMRSDGHVAAWSEKAERTFGWTRDEAVGRRLSELIIPPEFREGHERGLTHFLATGEGPVLDRHIEVTGMDKSGRELPLELSVTCSEQFGEKLFIGFVRDITERQQAASRQERMLRELILMDINLGRGLDGIEAAERIQAGGRAAVIFVSAYCDEATLARIRDGVPGAPLLTKPVSAATIQRAFEEALGGTRH